MRILIAVLLFLILFTSFVWGAKIPAPPVIKDKNIGEYLKTLYENNDILETTETAPNGNRRGRKGQCIIYDNSGTFELWINTDGETSWQQI